MVFKNIESYSFHTQQKILEIYNFYNKYILSPPELIMNLMQNKERRRKIVLEFEQQDYKI